MVSWYDFVVLAILFYTAWQGAQRGLLTQLAWIAALVLCFKFADKLAPAIDHAIRSTARSGLVVELGNIFAFQDEIIVFAVDDDVLFDRMTFRSRLRFDGLALPAFQFSPRR